MVDRAGRVNSHNPTLTLPKQSIGPLKCASGRSVLTMDSPTSSQSETQAAAPGGAPSGAPPRAASGSTAPATSTGVDALIRLGLIGLGPAGQFHAERLSLRPEFEIVAACDPAGQPARRLPGPRGTDRSINCDLAELLARADVAAVLITGPTPHRADWAERALRAGKHVCLDPPPCANANELHDLRSAARDTGRRLTVLPTFRGSADFRTALDVVRGARLGSLNAARLVSWGKGGPAGRPAPVVRSGAKSICSRTSLITTSNRCCNCSAAVRIRSSPGFFPPASRSPRSHRPRSPSHSRSPSTRASMRQPMHSST